MKTRIVLAAAVLSLVFVFGAFAALTIGGGNTNNIIGPGLISPNETMRAQLGASTNSSLSPALQNLLNEFAAEGAVVEFTRKTTQYIRDVDGVLTEIISTVQGTEISGEVSKDVRKTIHQVKAVDDVSLTMASAQIIESVFTGEDGNSYTQVQIVSVVDADGDGVLDVDSNGRPLSQIIVGWVEKSDGTGERQYFGTIQTDIVYDGTDIVDSHGADVSEMTLDQVERLLRGVDRSDMWDYAKTLF